MNVKTVDFVDVMNVAIMDLLEVNKSLICTQAFADLSVTVSDLEAEIKLVLKMLQGNAFRDNYKLVIVNGNTPCNHVLVNQHELMPIPELSKHLVVDAFARVYFKKARLYLPTTNDIEALYKKMFAKDQYKNIRWANLCVDYYTAHNALAISLQDLFTPCDKLNIAEVFSKDNIDPVLISPYEFYNNKYSDAIVVTTTIKLYAFIKSEVDCFIQSYLV